MQLESQRLERGPRIGPGPRSGALEPETIEQTAAARESPGDAPLDPAHAAKAAVAGDVGGLAGPWRYRADARQNPEIGHRQRSVEAAVVDQGLQAADLGWRQLAVDPDQVEEIRLQTG